MWLWYCDSVMMWWCGDDDVDVDVDFDDVDDDPMQYDG